MPFCPQCHDEYRPGFTRCVDCGVPLVEFLPEVPEPTEPPEVTEPPVVVYEAYSQAEADVICAKLEFFGVPAALGGDLALRNVYHPGAFTPIRILVPSDRAEEARRILQEEA